MPPKRSTVVSPSKALPASTSNASNEVVLRNAKGEDAGALVLYDTKGRVLGVSSKELILYAQEHGMQVIPARSLTGPEKLRIKADSLQGAIRAPFDIEELFRIAESQLDDQLAKIDRLQDPIFFHDDIVEYVNSRLEALQPQANKKKLTSNFTFVAGAIGTLIHNIYYLAGSWKQTLLLLKELKTLAPDLSSSNLRTHLKKKDTTFRDRFVLLYRHLIVLVGVLQKNVALATAASRHYARYFFCVQTAWMTFDRKQAMGAMKSLIDTIVMELVLPESEYPLHVLFACLRDSLEAAPKEPEKRFSQRLYDAIGDLGETIRALDMVEVVLSGDLVGLRGDIPPYTAAYEAYIDAEYFSIKASKNMSSIQQLVNPLTKTKDKGTLNRLWKDVNLVYTQSSGYDIDKTWQLQEDRKPTPQWSYVFPRLYLDEADTSSEFSDDEPEVGGHALVLHPNRKNISKGKRQTGVGPASGAGGPGDIVRYKGGKDGERKNKKVRKITGGEAGHDSANEDSDEPPGLANVSGSTDVDTDSEEEEESDDELLDSEEESDYDDEEMKELQKYFEAMMKDGKASDLFSKMGDDADGDDEGTAPKKPKFGPPRPPGMPEKKEEKKSKNPFVKMVNAFAGRFFSMNETLNSQRPAPPPKPKPAPPPPKTGKPPGLQAVRDDDDDDDMPPLEPIGTYPAPPPTSKPFGSTTTPQKEQKGSTKTRLEEVEDEEAKPGAGKKKRTKRRPGSTAPVPAGKPPTVAAQQAAATSPGKTTPKKGGAQAKPSASTSTTEINDDLFNPAFSYSSLSLHHPKAQSARAYLAEQGALEVRNKAKTRGDASSVVVPASIEEGAEPPTKEGFGKKMSKLFGGKKDKEEKKEEAKPDAPAQPFAVGKKVKNIMRQVFTLKGANDERTKTVKWEIFVKAMRGMGFTYVPGTAGSSVRFDPPDPKDKPITFHKPHPDPTLHYHMLQDFRKRLYRQYGWNEKQFDDLLEEETEEID